MILSKKAHGDASLAGLEEAFFSREGLPAEIDLNYCIPINIGIIAPRAYSGLADTQATIRSALEKFAKQMEELFGTPEGVQASVKGRNRTRIQYNLLVPKRDHSALTKFVADNIKKKLKAKKTEVDSYHEIKKKCWLALALWDGIPAGTTFEAVTSVLCYCPDVELSEARQPDKNQQDPDEYSMFLPESRPVFQILLPVEDESKISYAEEKKLGNFTLRDIYPHALEKLEGEEESKVQVIWYDRYHYSDSNGNDDRRANFAKTAKRIKAFNQEVIRYVKDKYESDINVWQLLGETRQRSIATSFSADMAEMRQICYDAISMKAQTGYKAEMRNIFWLAIAGLLCFAVFSDLVAIKLFYYSFFLLFILAYCLLFFLKKKNNQSCYLEFRAIAESMRVQCYWHMVGIRQSTGKIYAAKFTKDMSWAKYALNRWFEVDTEKNYSYINRSGDNQNQIEKALLVDYLESQRYYFNKRITDEGGKENNYNRKARHQNSRMTFFKCVWIVIGILLAVVLLCNLSSVWPFDFSISILNGGTIIDILVFCMSLANICALGYSYYSEKLLYKILVSRYTYCRLLAEKAIYDFNHSMASKTDIFRKYGEQALAENAEWLLIENDREPDVPNG